LSQQLVSEMRLSGMRPLLICRLSGGLSLAAIVIALAVGAWWCLPRTGITRENAGRIQPGITVAEVELMLGGPQRDESTAPLFHDNETGRPVRILPQWLGKWQPWRKHPDLLEWRSNEVIISVGLDDDDRVICSFINPVYVHQGPLELLRRWLRL
jgi:hypothetical protein